MQTFNLFLSTHILWIWILLYFYQCITTFWGLKDSKGPTHIDALNPFSSELMALTLRGGLWTFLANLALLGHPVHTSANFIGKINYLFSIHRKRLGRPPSTAPLIAPINEIENYSKLSSKRRIRELNNTACRRWRIAHNRRAEVSFVNLYPVHLIFEVF